MPFCNNCGQELAEGSKFCASCGKVINENNSNTQRKTTYEGEIHKCPNCGELLGAFVSVCSSCGYEIRGRKASDSIREFALSLARTESDAQKASLIRNFPIPNTKEDILEFVILAATNFNMQHDPQEDGGKKDISDAWCAKIEQSYQKAKLLFNGDKDFFEIQDVYDQTHSQIKELKQDVKRHSILNLVMRTIGLWGGLFIFIIAFVLDIFNSTEMSTVFHLSGGIVMIIGACIIGRKSTELLDVGVGVSCGIFALLLGTLLQVFTRSGSWMVLAGGVTLIIVVVRLVKTSLQNRR